MPTDHRGAISVKEAARYLSLGRTKTIELINEHRLDSLKIGRRRLVTIASLEKLLDERE